MEHDRVAVVLTTFILLQLPWEYVAIFDADFEVRAAMDLDQIC